MKVKLPDCGKEFEVSSLSFDEADDLLEREDKAKGVRAKRAVQRAVLEGHCPEAWEAARASNRDVHALYKGLVAVTFGDPEVQGN